MSHAYPVVPAAVLLLAIGMGCSGDKPGALDKHLVALQSQDAVTKHDAVIALGEMGPAAAMAVPALMKTLSDTNDDIRVAAAEALGKIGPAARAALPALEKALKDPDDRVQEAARQAINKIGK